MNWWIAGAVVLAIFAAISHVLSRQRVLEKRVADLLRERSEPYPSDGTDEIRAIADAKALCKKMGEAFTFHKAYKAVKAVREARKKKLTGKGESGDDGDCKRTA